jgi:Tetracyclin repressor-like, C-terminal domain
LRQELLGDREAAFEVIVARAMARGELGPKTPPARVVSLPVDLLRNELLLKLEPAAPETIVSIVDDAFLPLARVSSGLTED